MSTDSKHDAERKKKEKKQKDWLEAYIFSVLQKSMEAALNKAVNDLFKDWF